MNRYDDRARLVFHFAREEGARLGHAMIGPEHLLLGLMREGGSASRVLNDFGATLDSLRQKVEEIIGRGDGLPRNETAAITPRARRVMELAGSEARSLGATVIGTEHILLGIVREGDGVGYRILQGLTRDVDTIRWRILATEPGQGVDEREYWQRRLEKAQSELQKAKAELAKLSYQEEARGVRVTPRNSEDRPEQNQVYLEDAHDIDVERERLRNQKRPLPSLSTENRWRLLELERKLARLDNAVRESKEAGAPPATEFRGTEEEFADFSRRQSAETRDEPFAAFLYSPSERRAFAEIREGSRIMWRGIRRLFSPKR